MGKAYTGVSIGNESVKLAVCDGDAVKVIVTEKLPEGLMTPGRPVSLELITDILKRLVRRSSGIVKDAALVIPKVDTVVRRIKVPMMTEKELTLNLPYEFRDYISQGRDRYMYDYAVLHTNIAADGDPESMELLVAATLKQTIADYSTMFRRAGLRMKKALPSQAAYQNLVGSSPRALANCCVINFSHTAAKLHFFVNGIYDVTRIIEIGGVDIDQAIASDMGVDIHMANGYKHMNYEGAQSSPSALRVYERVAVEVGHALNFYSYNNPEMDIGIVYFGGGGSLLQPLMDTVTTRIDVELRSIVDIMPPMQGKEDLRSLCPSAVGATLEMR